MIAALSFADHDSKNENPRVCLRSLSLAIILQQHFVFCHRRGESFHLEACGPAIDKKLLAMLH